MSRPESGAQVIEPHALAFDGFRWHARAFCRRDGVLKDFLLSRILEARDSGLTESASADDRAWQEKIELVIAPHPGLSEAQTRVFEMDYAMEEGVARIPVRRALLHYALKRLGLDTDPDARAPRDQQIVLVNRDEVMAALGA
ncbi:hypothetical protein [Rhodovulum marinum]|uniref:WYL domain-containing protein n=1 Tax=Rhodovulum marinum TaxID=320662 RepID=A0A4R2PSA6_9RHOB|nr:hypothetical protein [Rhodovulum marinum]TCP38813.1 hypothetical protein EV662_11747 [Rhodovulum marinum]